VAAVLLGMGSAGVASASTGWAVQHVPEPPGGQGGSLTSVSCVSGGTCIAFGYYRANDAQGKLVSLPYAVRKTSSTGWKVTTVSLPADYQTGGLVGVSCASASFCAAIGYYTSTTNGTELLSETWNGTSWTLQSVPVPANSYLPEVYGVSCASPTACMAVGTYTTSSAEFNLAELWNGTSWTVVPTATEANSQADALQSVSCPSASACMAVGINYTTAGPGLLVAESWNGSTWTNTPIKQPTGVRGSNLVGVSCSSASACTATGNTDAEKTAAPGGLAERWNGTSWKIQAVPGGQVSLGNVACPTAASCTAIAGYPGVTPTPAIYTWTSAGGWVAGTAATPSGATFTGLGAISCLSATKCTAAGYYSTAPGGVGHGQPVAEQE
jgi:hypothetical protein